MARLRQREIPWCTLFLTLGAMVSHICVLSGNLKTSAAMKTIGSSAAGWSDVGLGLGRALQTELDFLMAEVSKRMVTVIEHVLRVQEALDTVVATVGNVTDQAIDYSALLPGATASSIFDYVMQAARGALQNALATLNNLLDTLLIEIKPVLTQIGEWMLRFGGRIQAGVESFTTSMDTVQKLLDQLMSQLHSGGGRADDLLRESFTLFDVSNTGYVTVQDLRNIGQLYSLQALEGNKPEELAERYDHDGDDRLNRAELSRLVSDPSIPKVMSSMLRTYARKLVEVAGNVASATTRDEIGLYVVQYFQLVCAKNATKVGWVSDALGNGSLPLDFTAAVFAQLCLQENTPEVLTTVNIGQLVLTEIYNLHREQTLDSIARMANTTFWFDNGFNPLDHPRCVRRLAEWLAEAKQAAVEDANTTSLLGMDTAEAAGLQAERAMRQHLLRQCQERAAWRSGIVSSAVSRQLLLNLTGGIPASELSNTNARRAINGGQPAFPSTRRFAEWLGNNATATAQRLQDMCFDYASTSSNKLDNFATQIQSLVKTIQTFIEMMTEWSTPAGISKLENLVRDFQNSTEDDVMKILEKKLPELIDGALHTAAGATDARLDRMTAEISDAIHNVVRTPLVTAHSGPLGDTALGKPSYMEMEVGFGGTLGSHGAGTNNNKTLDATEYQLKSILDAFVPKALHAVPNTWNFAEITAKPTPFNRVDPALLSIGDPLLEADDISQAWTILTTALTSLSNHFPTAVSTLKFGRAEVTKAGANLISIFQIFKIKGPKILTMVAKLWTLTWALYFVVLLPLTFFNLYYVFWASGFFGGPQPAAETDGAIPPRTWRDRFRICCTTCCVCMKYHHDTPCCFWSLVIFMQVIMLVIFIASIALCILAAVKEFIVLGCAQVYILGDLSVCRNSIHTLKRFLQTFVVADTLEDGDSVCLDNMLLTCSLITNKMKSSVILTTVFSILATVLSMQVIIDSALMHEQARFRRSLRKMELDEEEMQERLRQPTPTSSSREQIGV